MQYRYEAPRGELRLVRSLELSTEHSLSDGVFVAPPAPDTPSFQPEHRRSNDMEQPARVGRRSVFTAESSEK